MNNLLTTIMSVINHEWANNLTENPLKYFFHSYGEVVGLDVFFTFMFGVMAIAIFVHSNHNKSITIGFFLLVQIFMVALLPSPFTIVMFVIASLLAASAAFYTYFKKEY